MRASNFLFHASVLVTFFSEWNLSVGSPTHSLFQTDTILVTVVKPPREPRRLSFGSAIAVHSFFRAARSRGIGVLRPVW